MVDFKYDAKVIIFGDIYFSRHKFTFGKFGSALIFFGYTSYCQVFCICIFSLSAFAFLRDHSLAKALRRKA